MTTPTDISITNPLPARVVVVDTAAMAKINAMAERAHKAAALAASLPDGLFAERKHFDAAADLYRSIAAMEKQIEDNRKTLKAPVTKYGRDLDAAAKTAAAPLNDARNALGVAIARYQSHLDELAEQARIAEQQRRDAEEAARRAERDRQADDAMASLLGDTSAPEPASAPVDMPAVIEAPEPSVRVVRMMKVYDLEIVDVAAIPREFMVPDESAIKRAMKDGAEVPGCKLHVSERPAATGR